MHRIQRINNSPGTYVLLARSAESGQVQIGQRRVLPLAVGWYVYVGSAFGPGGLAARVGRHLRHDKTLRWHIDYLRAHVGITEVWLSESQQHLEHTWASFFCGKTLLCRYIVLVPRIASVRHTCFLVQTNPTGNNLIYILQTMPADTSWFKPVFISHCVGVQTDHLPLGRSTAGATAPITPGFRVPYTQQGSARVSRTQGERNKHETF